MPDNSAIHHRHSVRLAGYDYSGAGAYFITICSLRRECLFGKVEKDEMRLSPFGDLVAVTWKDLVNHIPGIELGSFVVMPNHVHGIVELLGVGDGTVRATPLAEIVRQFKTFSTRRINILRATLGAPMWQRNYYEHIIRSDEDWRRISVYIEDNPRKWAEDTENPRLCGFDRDG